MENSVDHPHMIVDRAIEDKLRSLGLTRVYQGYHYLLHCARLAREDRAYLVMPTKRLYPDTARTFGVKPEAVDSSIRAAISLCCIRCPDRVERMCEGKTRPTVTEFLQGLVEQLITWP